MTKLQWELQPDSGAWFAYSGEGTVGTIGIVKNPNVPTHGMWWYNTRAIDTRHITKGNGHVKTEQTAKKAVERAWADWCNHYGLILPPAEPTEAMIEAGTAALRDADLSDTDENMKIALTRAYKAMIEAAR